MTTNRIALVTGGTGGLGTAICKALRGAGYRVFANYHPADENNALQWKIEQSRLGFDLDIVEGDVSNFEDCQRMASEITRQGDVAVLVNNAGIVRDSTLKKMEPHQWQAVLDTNLGGLYNVTRQFIDGMTAAGFGRIINISSVNGQRGQFGQTNYSAAKAGVHGFTMALAREIASKQVTVNSISPGFIDTDMVKTIPEDLREEIIRNIPVGRVGQPEDIVNAVAFLAHADSGYITGANLPVNGGVFMH